MILLIFVLSSILYYIGLIYLAKAKFKLSDKTLTFRTGIYLPFYILKTCIKTNNFSGLNPIETIIKTERLIAEYEIYLVVLIEIVNYQTKNKSKLTFNAIFNSEINATFEKFLTEMLEDSKQQ